MNTRVLVAAAFFAVQAANAQTGVTVEIATGLTPRMQPADVRQIALTALAEPVTDLATGASQGRAGAGQDAAAGQTSTSPPAPEIVSMKCATADRFGTVTDANGEVDRRLTWKVEAKGSFINHRVPDGVAPTVRKQGFLLIDDETGQIVGRGSFKPKDSMTPGQDVR